MAKDQFTDRQKEAIQQAIARAELDTSGEIRVHIDKKCKTDPVERAVAIFHQLRMDQTTQQNGVLIYVAMSDRKLAIVGDKGINAVVPDHFWDDERDLMISYFKNGQFTEGLVEGIKKVGEQMKQFFPYIENDANELSNDVTFGGDEEQD
jgi:uncharacterized membrane protein